MPAMDVMTELLLEEQARQVVYLYAKNDLSAVDRNIILQREQVKLVWFSKMLQNWKAMVFIPDFPSEYYEVTFDGDAQEIYLDVYRKVDKVTYSFNPVDLVNPSKHGSALEEEDLVGAGKHASQR